MSAQTNVGPQLVTASLVQNVYQTPTKQHKTRYAVGLTCVHANPVGYKVMCESSRPHVELSGARGVLPPGKTLNVEFEADGSNTAVPCFTVRAIEWPRALKSFDAVLFTKLEEKKDAAVQIIILGEGSNREETLRTNPPPTGYPPSVPYAAAPPQQTWYPPAAPIWPPVAPPALPFAPPSVAPSVEQCVQAQPTRLVYKPPYGSKDQTCRVTVTNTRRNDKIAFKTTTDENIWAFYTVSPSNGTVVPGKSCKVDVTLNGDVDGRALVDDHKKRAHYFRLQARKWPPFDEYSSAQWKASTETIQEIKLNVTLDTSGKKVRDDASDRSDKKRSRANDISDRRGTPPPSSPPRPKQKEQAAATSKITEPTELQDPTRLTDPIRKEGPALVQLYPKTLVYRPPYGKVQQDFVVDAKCVSAKPVAFKIQAADYVWKYFSVQPFKGVLEPGKALRVTFIMQSGFDHKDLKQTSSSPYEFYFMAVNWVQRLNTVDDGLWNDITTANKDSVQSSKLTVDLETTGAFSAYIMQGRLTDTPQESTSRFDVSQYQPPLPPTDPWSPPPPAKVKTPSSQQLKLPSPPSVNKKPQTPQRSPVTSVRSNREEGDKKPAEPAKKVDKTPVPQKTKIIKEESKCDLLLAILPMNKVRFRVPGVKQCQILKFKSVSDKPVAFKIITAKKLCYKVSPTKAVIKPRTTREICFDTTEALTLQELKKDQMPHNFQVTATVWDEKMEFDDAKFKHKLSFKDAVAHTLVINIEHNAQPGANSPKERGPVEPHKLIENAINLPQPQLEEVVATQAEQMKGASDLHSKMGGQMLVNVVNVKPSQIAFKAPYGIEKQTKTLTLTNRAKEPMAYKILANRVQFYMVKPGKGVVYPGNSVKVEIELNEKFTDEEKKKTPASSHKFQMVSMPWPWNEKRFDTDLWKKLEEKKTSYQTTDIDVEYT